MRIEHLTKIYKSKGTNGVGLDDVSFTLPDTGMVFIVGKSGSGKSTLLNMLGGLDEITSGDIIIGDKRFSEFSNTDFDNYRNSHLGFVFQDFCLINELTVADNIRLALDFQGDKHEDALIADILEKVDLTEFANRKPTQLSGGQRQRVAIARALVKSPELILADEPTGNLDSKTAVQVLELLKELSRDILVLVVSHNVADAEKYADRMIELADGKVIRDVTRNENHDNSFAVENDVVYLPDKTRLTDEELERFNEAISAGDKKVVQRETAFSDTVEDEIEPPPHDEIVVDKNFIPSKLSTKRTIEISGKFMRKKLLTSILMTVLITAVVVLFGLSNIFVDFDGAAAMNNAMQTSTDPAFVMNKGFVNDDLIESLNTTYACPIHDDDISTFIETGYDGHVYGKLAWSLPVAETTYSMDNGTIENISLYSNFYATETRGILVCDEAFLAKIFGVNGSVTVLAGQLVNEEHPEGLIVTDYIADSLIAYGVHVTDDDYDLLIDRTLSGRVRINAVIQTDYKERFSGYLGTLRAGGKVTKQEVAEFQEYAENYLAIAYTFNQNYKEDFIESEISNLGKLRKVAVTANGREREINMGSYMQFRTNPDKQTTECTMAVDLYNEICGTAYTLGDERFTPTHMTFKLKGFGLDTILGTVELDVTELIAGNYAILVYNREVVKQVQNANLMTVSLYFDDFDNISEIYEVGTENDFYSATAYFKTVQSITKIVAVFKDIFALIAIGLCGVMVLLMAFFAFSNIRSRNYEIGVMKAMGARTRNVAGIFLVQVICVGLAICLLFGLFFYFGMPLANKLLMDSLVEYVNDASISGITLLAFDGDVMWMSIGIVLGVTVVSAFMPFIGVMTIKPANIIKARE